MARQYSSELSKGQAAVDETLALLRLWSPGMSPPELFRQAMDQGILGKESRTRVSDLVTRVFARRYLGNDALPARMLKYLDAHNASRTLISQLMLIHTCRQHPILEDFICEVIWPRYANSCDEVTRDHALRLIQEAPGNGLLEKAWAPSLALRVARYLTGTCGDFGFLSESKTASRRLLRFIPLPETVLCLAWEQRQLGRSDSQLLELKEWAVLGLDRASVIAILEQLALKGHFILQIGGGTLQISWKYKSLEECLNACC